MTVPESGRQVPGHRVRAAGRREEVWQLLRDVGGPMAIAEVAERLGIHANTARFHLESLASNGRVERTTADTAPCASGLSPEPAGNCSSST